MRLSATDQKKGKLSAASAPILRANKSKQKFIEVKGRPGVGEIALTANEYKAAPSLSDEYWLYVVFNCASEAQVTVIQNPARLDWEALSKIDCYRIGEASAGSVRIW